MVDCKCYHSSSKILYFEQWPHCLGFCAVPMELILSQDDPHVVSLSVPSSPSTHKLGVPEIMRIFCILQCILLFAGIGYTFRITDFLETLINQGDNSDRQAADNVDPGSIFIVTFFASLLNGVLSMILNPTTSATGRIEHEMILFWLMANTQTDEMIST